ncbi:hypothetical protein DFW101_1560 [Solidesulfovibrio carbinoliphilus subsp. oakridgensis]|uniref:Uncharacterized protein n=1 Tax=Solidesulfovibrio carbinoliphilus subsp. oakridgensis TaxID=694327 RepID=G7Q6F5_9BACT|nr:hypothetical protein [Solidesulfovibrio carbinoliphilus]EHJ47568.1 hypothetical protein DFW101_1560 [Solidesulfovibrio carbinoliphilus subsp. oakridgensis]
MADDLLVSMEIPPDIAFARLLTAAAETLALRKGFDQRASLRLQLTAEEFFLCLVGLAEDTEPLRVVLTGKRHTLRLAFAFTATSLSLGALNVTAGIKACPAEEPSHDLGLLLAGKAADRFHLDHKGDKRFLLEAEVDRAYPPAPQVRPPAGLRPPYTVRACTDPAQLAQGAALALAVSPAWHCPQSFRTPGKFADRVEDGQIACVAAFDAAGQLAGLLSWSPCSDRALFFSGPFVFAPEGDAGEVARLLVDGFLAAVAREKYEIVLSFRATADAPPDAFESLGCLELHRDGNCRPEPVLFRHLREDAGTAVWSRPALLDFLRETYDRLAMPRDILPVAAPQGRERRESLLGCTLDRNRDLGELRPFLDGEDMAGNLAAHVCALRDKGICNILYYMDLSRPWEAALADDLIQAGFAPKVVLPHGGHGDLVVWQHVRPH